MKGEFQTDWDAVKSRATNLWEPTRRGAKKEKESSLLGSAHARYGRLLGLMQSKVEAWGYDDTASKLIVLRQWRIPPERD